MAALLTVFAAVFLVQLVMGSYIQGVARAAADEGVRAGSRVAAGPPTCETRAAEVFQSLDRKSTRLNSSHIPLSRMPSSA